MTGTMKAIIDSNANQMPHQMRGVGNGRVDTLKYLPVGNNWKRIRADANKVSLLPDLLGCIPFCCTPTML